MEISSNRLHPKWIKVIRDAQRISNKSFFVVSQVVSGFINSK